MILYLLVIMMCCSKGLKSVLKSSQSEIESAALETFTGGIHKNKFHSYTATISGHLWVMKISKPPKILFTYDKIHMISIHISQLLDSNFDLGIYVT